MYNLMRVWVGGVGGVTDPQGMVSRSRLAI
jgi:hypothetical protein